MSNNREPIQIVEIDLDYCTRTYGTAPCLAVLGTTGVRKCYNTFATCQYKSAYDGNTLDTTTTINTKTYRFAGPRVNFPLGIGTYFPVLTNISALSSTVNIAGSDESLSAFGRRATVKVDLVDFPTNDVYSDKYQAQRIAGTAQTDESGYDPKDRGSFFSKLRSRNPYYAGRPLRIIDGYIEGGALVNTRTRNYIITNMTGPDSDGNVTFEAKDILALADNKKAVAPKASRGTLTVDMGISDTSFTLTPTSVGSEYATSGYATIGSEIVTFTRSGDVVTLTGRGVSNTVASTHSAGDSFQQALAYSHARIDDVIKDLLINFAGINSSYIDSATWSDEITNWMSSVYLDTIISKPIGVNQLVGELAVLGISIWWDDVNQKIGLKCNRPLFDDVAYPLSDRNNIKEIEQEDLDQYRLTQIHFYSVQTDPTKDVSAKENYDRLTVTIDSESESKKAYGDTRVREVFCRWLNMGADSIVGLLSIRLLNRFNTAPKTYSITLDAKDRSVGLADVIEVTSRAVTDETGNPVATNLQVIKLSESKFGHEVEVTAQAYDYEGRFARVMANTANDYGSATALEKSKGGYIVDGGTLVFASDGSSPYVTI